MRLLIMIGIVLLTDRAIPAGAWAYGVKFYTINEHEFYRRYGLIAFPRTLLEVAVCVSLGLNLILPISIDVQQLVTISLFIIFVTSALLDVWRIGR
jgi:hypothetical protein